MFEPGDALAGEAGQGGTALRGRPRGVRPRGRRALLGDVRQVCSMASTGAFGCYRGCSAAMAATQIDTATTKASTNPMVASTSFSCYV